MTLEQYKARMKEQEDWAPGWEAVDRQFEALYPGQKPEHYATLLPSRAVFGGEEYLDGYSIYHSPGGYFHIVTYGMSALYSDENAFGAEWSGWGYEMTMKLKAGSAEECRWALNMLGNLARYTFKEQRFFEPYQFVGGDGSSICLDKPSAITSLLVVPDTEVPGVDTLHGRLDFLQLVGITWPELETLLDDAGKAKGLAQRLQARSPQLVTDLDRVESYL